MDVANFFRIWGRRWMLSTATLAVAGATIIGALLTMPRTYQGGASVMMLAPRSAARTTGGNPYLSFSPSLTLTASAVGDEVMSPGTAARLSARGYRAAYTVTLAPYTTDTTGSVLLVSVTGGSPPAVQGTLRAVTAQVSAALAALQDQEKVGPRHRVTAVMLSYSPRAALAVTQTARSLIMVIVPAALAALAFPVLVDAWLLRRSARRRSAHVLNPAGH